MVNWNGKDMSFRNKKNKPFVYLRVPSWLNKKGASSPCIFIFTFVYLGGKKKEKR